MTTVDEVASLLTRTFGTAISGDSQSCTSPDPASPCLQRLERFAGFSLTCRKFTRMFNKTGFLDS